MKRRFTILTAALALLTFLAVPMGMRGQSDYSTDYTGNITLSTSGGSNASTCKVKINNTDYNGIKAGTGSKTGAVQISVPANTKYLHLHVAAWNGETVSLAVTPTGYSNNISLTSDSGISGSGSTYTLAGTLSNYYKVITFTNALTANTNLTFTATGGKRFVVWGVSSEEDGDPTYTVTYDANGGTGTMTDTNSPYNAGATVTVLGNEFTRTDYEFDHWNTAADNSGDSYDEDDTFTINANTILYAQWTENTTPGPGGNTQTLTFDVSSNPGGWPTTNSTTLTNYTYTLNSVSYTFALKNVKCNSGYLMMTATAVLGLPAIEGYKLTKVVASNSNGCSTSTQVGISSSASQASYINGGSAQTWSTTGSQYTYNLTNTDENTMYYLYVTNKNAQVTSLALTYESVGGTPTPSISADDVNIAYDIEEGYITYTINNPVEGGSIVASCDAEWIEVDDTPQTDAEGSIDFLCASNSNFYAHSATVTLTYTYGDSKATVTKIVTVTQALNPDANGSTIDYPIMVSEAIDAIDEVGTVSNIYVGGIVSNIVEEYSSQYHNITFDMIDEEGDEYFLRAYRCVGTDGVDASEVAVGDYVIVKGDLKLYTSSNSSIYELGQGCQLVSLTHPVVPAITLSSYSIEATAEETEGTLTVTYTEIETELDPEIYWFESDGETTASEPDWMSAEINAQLNVDYLIEENEGAARTAYFKVYGLDTNGEDVYSDLVTVSQAAAPQQYTLEVTSISNAEIFVFDATDPDETNWVYLFEGVDEVQVLEGTQIALSVTAEEGYTLTSLMVNNEDHVNDIQGGLYTFTMPASNVTITATAEESVAPAGGDYVRITSLDQLTDGSIVVIAARYDEEHTNGYYAMSNATSGKPTGVLFTSTTSGNNEILPASIVDNEDDYYWVVNETEDGYTFTNAEGFMIGYNSSTNFATGGDNTEWTIASHTSGSTTMVSGYTGFKIVNFNNTSRAIALNESHNFGPYSTSNMTGNDAYKYNFSLDVFVQTSAPATETYTLENITGYTGEKDHYYLIASPVTVDPEDVVGMTEGDFDLYYFDESEDDEWRNYEANPFNLIPGKGYLYAKKATNENSIYSFELTGTPYSGNGEIGLDYDDNAEFPGFNLIGNPFGNTANLSLPYYRLNQDGSALNTSTESSEVNVMEGVFVQATAATRTATFAPSNTGFKRISQLNVKVTRNRGAVLDNAIIRFDDGAMLGKFQLNPNDTKIYITEGNQDYAIVRSANAGEMPVSFKAAENGNYTLSIETENVEVSYLHLIDNMTGADVDLLATPSYSFNARTTDNANRFRLMFNTNGVDENATTANFAYFNGSSWTISNMGEATLQVVDMMGRVISTQAISGNTDVNLNQAAGVYMLRLVTGNDVKVQKVVVR